MEGLSNTRPGACVTLGIVPLTLAENGVNGQTPRGSQVAGRELGKFVDPRSWCAMKGPHSRK